MSADEEPRWSAEDVEAVAAAWSQDRDAPWEILARLGRCPPGDFQVAIVARVMELQEQQLTTSIEEET